MTIQGFDIISLVTGGVLEQSDSSSPTPTPPVVSGTPTQLDRKMLNKVVTILTKYGKTVIFKIYPAAVYDPATGQNTKGTASQYAKKVIPPCPVYVSDGEKYVPGDLIRVGDLATGVAAKDIEFTPEPGIEVVIDSVTWKVIQVKPVYANEKIVLYGLQLRK